MEVLAISLLLVYGHKGRERELKKGKEKRLDFVLLPIIF